MFRRQILVVEDEAAIALDLMRLLRDHGAKVVGPASSADEALKLVDRFRIHGAVLDVKLGQSDCAAVARVLTWNAVPFVFVTGYSQSEVVKQYPWSPIIRKPYLPTEMIDRIKSVLG